MPGVPEWLKDAFGSGEGHYGPHTLTGAVDGASVTVRYLSEAHGSVTIWWTEIEVPYPPGTPYITFSISPHQSAREQEIREGLVRDLELGDPEFDRVYVVNAAPADIVRELLDAPTRAAMLAIPSLTLRTAPKGLVAHHTDWIRDMAELERVVHFAIGVVRRIEPAAAEAATAQRNDPGRAAYRHFKTVDEIAHDRSEDIRALSATEAHRREVMRLRGIRAMWITLAVVAALVALGGWLVWRYVRIVP